MLVTGPRPGLAVPGKLPCAIVVVTVRRFAYRVQPAGSRVLGRANAHRVQARMKPGTGRMPVSVHLWQEAVPSPSACRAPAGCGLASTQLLLHLYRHAAGAATRSCSVRALPGGTTAVTESVDDQG
jgi:hypothetical protein